MSDHMQHGMKCKKNRYVVNMYQGGYIFYYIFCIHRIYNLLDATIWPRNTNNIEYRHLKRSR